MFTLNPVYEKKVCYSIIVVSALYYLALTLYLIHNNVFLVRDSEYYIYQANSFFSAWKTHNDNTVFDYPYPFFAIVLAISQFVNVSSVLWGHVIVVSSGVGLIIVLSILSTLLFNNYYAGAIAAFFASTLPFYINYSCEIMRDIPFYLLYSLVVLLFVRYEKKLKPTCLILLSLILSTAIHLRIEGWLLFFSILICLIYVSMIQKQKIMTLLKSLSIFGLSFCISFSALALIVYQCTFSQYDPFHLSKVRIFFDSVKI